MMSNKTFKVIEDYQSPDISIIQSMIDGSNPNPVYIIREYISENICKKLKNSFFEVLGKTNGGNRQRDFVPVLQVGATQFNKSTSDYFLECKKTKNFY